MLCHAFMQKSISSIFPYLRAINSGCSGPVISIIELVQDLITVYTVTKFGADCFIFADARV